MTGVNPKVEVKITERVFLDFILENYFIIRQVPFSVVDNDYDVILGHNFLTSYRYKMYWKEERLFMKLGFSNLIRIYINELGSKVYQCPLSLDNMPTDNSGDFVVTFSEQNALI